MSVERQEFGKTKEGQKITLFTVTNEQGMVMKVTDFGAIGECSCERQRWGV